MVNVNTQIVASLSAIYPTYYELLSKKATKPCITYIEGSNISQNRSATLEYSNINYTIKLWGEAKDIGTLIQKQSLIDDAMRTLGFKRVGGNTMAYDTQLCYVMNYEALGQEGTNSWI